MGVGFRTFFPKRPDTKFVVRNITLGTPQQKRIKLFTYPIPPGQERDLLAIPEVSEADIRHSLLKGELRRKAECGEIRVVDSNIDLLQFDEFQKDFLENLGITEGLEVVADGYAVIPFLFKQNVVLVGALDGVNRTFTVPSPDKFIEGTFGGNKFKISVRHNGRELVKGVDYVVSESAGVGTGYDTVTIIAFAPQSGSILVSSYVVGVA